MDHSEESHFLSSDFYDLAIHQLEQKHYEFFAEESDDSLLDNKSSPTSQSTLLLDKVVLTYPHKDDPHPIEIRGKQLLSLQPERTLANEMLRFALRSVLTKTIPPAIRDTILYFDLNVLEMFARLPEKGEERLDFLRAHSLTPVKKYLVFPTQIATKEHGPAHSALIVVSNFARLFHLPSFQQVGPILIYAHLLDPQIIGGDAAYRGEQCNKLSNLISLYFSTFYHRYMGRPATVEIIVIVCASLLPQSYHPEDSHLYTIKYLEFFFNNAKERADIISRQTSDLRDAFKWDDLHHYRHRKALLENFLKHIEPTESRQNLRLALAERCAFANGDFFTSKAGS